MSKWFTGGTAAVIAAFAIGSVVPMHAQSSSAGLALPFASPGTSAAGGVQLAGILRIAQFSEQSGQAFAAGTLSVSAANTSSAATGSSLVIDLVIPVVSITSGSTAATVAFNGTASGGTASTASASTMAPGSVFSTAAVAPISTATAAPIGTAGVPTSPVPGQVATCGPIHLVVGPIDVNQPSLVLHVDRLTVDIASTPGVASPTNDLLCTAEAALSQASSSGNSSPTTSTQPSSAVTPSIAVGVAPATAGTVAVGTAGATGTVSSPVATVGTAATTTVATQQLTPLQSVVALLNQLVGTL